MCRHERPPHKPLVITGQDVPIDTNNGLQRKRQGMKTTNEEANVIISQVQKATDDW